MTDIEKNNSPDEAVETAKNNSSPENNKRFSHVLLGALAGCIATSAAFYGADISARRDAAIKPDGLLKFPFPVEVLSSFSTPIDNIVGWTLKAQGENALAYATKDGQYILVGNMIDKNGTSLTEKSYIEHFGGNTQAASSQASPANQESLAAQMTIVRSVALEGLTINGTGEGDVYIAVDLNCPYCHKMIAQIESMMKQGTPVPSIHIVPVAILGADSVVATALFQQQPVTRRMELMFGWMNGTMGKIATKAFPLHDKDKADIDAQGIAKIGQELGAAGMGGVPATYWLDNGVVKSHNGLLPESEIRTIFKM